MNTQSHCRLDIEEVIQKIRDLPIMPQIAEHLLGLVNDEQTDLHFLSEKIAMDQALTSKILRLANSSHFGNNSRVVTIQQATTLLGVDNIKNLVRMTLLSNHLPIPNCAGFDFRSYWAHGVGTAICAELISRTLHMKHDFAFTAGLLHDLGRLVLATYYPLQYSLVIESGKLNDCSLLEAERNLLHIDHAEVGYLLARHWHFADAVQDAIRGHHTPDIHGLNSLAMVVHVANAIVHGLDLSGDEQDQLPLLSELAWDTLGLDESAYHDIFRETEQRYAAMAQIFT